MKEGANIILITIDSLRADHLGCYGYSRDVSPNLDTLANNGVLFQQAIANGSGTWPSTISLLTSSYPLMYGGYERFSSRRTMISEVLREEGYYTAAFISDPFLARLFNHEGFDTIYDGVIGRPSFLDNFARNDTLNFLRKLLVLRRGGILYPRADKINEKAISWLKKRSTKFFIWLQYMDIHNPYQPPRKYVKQFCPHPISMAERFRLNHKIFVKSDEASENEIRALIDLYDAGLRYVDHNIGLLFDRLREMDILHNTLIIITADHGNEFKEHGDFGHHRKLYDELLLVPLIFHGAGMRKNIAIEDLVSLLDIAPTLVEILGIQNKNRNFQGRSLVPLIAGGEDKEESELSGVISEIGHNDSLEMDLNERKISYRTKRWKYIYNQSSEDELYDIRADHRETQNVIEEKKDIAKKIKQEILDHILDVERSE